MSLLKMIRAQLGLSATAANNFTLDSSADNGTMKLARGNAGATTQDIITVDASGVANAAQGLQQGGVAVPRMVLAAAQNTTSGTAIDFTGLPSWVKRITVAFNGVSTNGTSSILLQSGSGSIVTTGYSSSASFGFNGNQFVTSTAGVILDPVNTAVAAYARFGSVTLTMMGSNIWACSGQIGSIAGAVTVNVSGVTPAFGGSIDRLRLTTVNGTDTFDAGSCNILYEG